jgi:hypothetical protein
MPHTSFPHFYVPPPLQVSVHVTREPSGALDFVHKNFTFRNMSLKDLMAAVSGGGGGAAAERYYLRSVGVNPRKEASQLQDSFPFLASDVHLPLHLLPPPPPPSSTSSSPPSTPSGCPKLFSSVLRISSPGLRLWTHYDVMDNILVQIRGNKQVSSRGSRTVTRLTCRRVT